MRKLDFQDEFDCVLLLFTAFGYFEDNQNLDVLCRIARALRPGGRLIFDIHNRDVFMKGYQPDHIVEKNGDLMMDRHHFEMAEGRLYNRRIVIRNGMRREKPYFVRLYNPTEITDLLRRAGLQVTGLFGSWDGQPISSESRRMIVIASKVTQF
jgi:SAM-dependent methyltransferase